MRRLGPPALVLLALLLAGSAAARDPRDPQQRHTAADMRLARSIAVKRTDLAPGWKLQPQQKPPPPCSSEPDESRLVQTARIDPSFVWKDGVTIVGSEIDIFKTAAQARLDWRLTTLKLIQACLLESARRTLGKQHIAVRVGSVSTLAPPRQGERGFHYRLVFELGKKPGVPAVTEIVGIGVGRVSVILHAFSLRGPLPKPAIDTLTAVLARRLVAASGGV